MDIALKKISECFGPGYRVLNARFACVDLDDGDFACADLGASSTSRATPISTVRDLVWVRSPAFRPWNHPIPGNLGQSRVGQTSRRRPRHGASWRSELLRTGRAPLVLAAAGIAVSFVLAIMFPALELRLAAASRQHQSPASVSAPSQQDSCKTPSTVDTALVRHKHRHSFARSEKDLAVERLPSPSFASTDWSVFGDRSL